MIAALPDGPRGRLLALGLTLLLIVAAWLAVAEPLLAWHRQVTQDVANRGAVRQRMAAIGESLPELRRQMATGGTAPVAMALLEGTTDALAGAALQARVRELATVSEVSLTSVETLAAETNGSYRRIGVRISTTCSWPLLIRLLQELEQAAPVMLVDDVQLQAAVSVAGTVTRPLTVTLTVLAFRAVTPP